MTELFDTRVQRKAEAHLRACYEAMEAYETEDIDHGPVGAVLRGNPSYGPFCGCDTCIVREVLSVCWDEMLAEAKRQVNAEHTTPEAIEIDDLADSED